MPTAHFFLYLCQYDTGVSIEIVQHSFERYEHAFLQNPVFDKRDPYSQMLLQNKGRCARPLPEQNSQKLVKQQGLSESETGYKGNKNTNLP